MVKSRIKRLVVLVSVEEWSAWQRAAERQFLTVSELIRKSVNESTIKGGEKK